MVEAPRSLAAERIASTKAPGWHHAGSGQGSAKEPVGCGKARLVGDGVRKVWVLWGLMGRSDSSFWRQGWQELFRREAVCVMQFQFS